MAYHGENGISGAAGDYDNDALFSSGNRFNGNEYKVLDPEDVHWAWGEAIKHRARYRTWPELQNIGQEEDRQLDIQPFKSLDRKCENMPVGPTHHRTAG